MDQIEERLAELKPIQTSGGVMVWLCYSSNCYVDFASGYSLEILH